MDGISPTQSRYEVVVIGGSLAGAAAATLLLRERPGLRVLIVEKTPRFTRRVGEATVEISAFFLGRVVGLTRHLNEAHLVKQGMRFWFANNRTQTLADCAEIGGRYQVRLPAYQLDRAVIDEELLQRAVALGAELHRPGRVGRVELSPGGDQTVVVDNTALRTRWVVDASGVAALLARQQGWWRTNADHPTAACWARWRNVKDWDDPELAAKFPEWAGACYGIRNTATNHLLGDGWWAWWIPLKGGDVSIGVVFDQRLVQWPADGPLGNRLRDFLMQHPAARELLADAQCIDGDVHWRRNLAYSSATLAGDGFALVGDAAGFLDPLYSPGMDWISYTVSAAVQLIAAQTRGEPLTDRLARHNADFARSYHRWFTAIYQDKYEYLAEFDLMRRAFLLDLGLYYLGVVSQPFRRGPAALLEPTYSTAPSTPFYYLMRTYNRRFAQIARARRRRGALGRHNDHRRFLFPSFSLEPTNVKLILRALASWGALEVTEGWRSWGRSGHAPGRPASPPAGAPAIAVGRSVPGQDPA